jgi:UDP-N-acetylmuramoyl-tripeptide--D-alanyl-D-alanine ligase
VIDLTVAQIADIVGGRLADISPAEAQATIVTGTVEFDSRAIGPGGLFLALPGARADGHDFAAGAMAAGAVAVLAARPVGVPAIVVPPAAAADENAGVLEYDTDGSGAAVLSALAKLATAVAADLVASGLRIIGITGSSGKTSTKDLIVAVLRPLGAVVAPPGSFNNELGHPWTVLRATRETGYLVLEMSARHPGNIAALAAIAPPSIAVVLNVGTAHLGEFGSREVIAQTKAELVQAVPASGVAVLNADDPIVAAMAAQTAARVVTVGRSKRADVRAEDVELDELARPRFILRAGAAAVPVALAVHGEHQVGNALSAAAVALECGATPQQVADALAGAAPASRHRMEVDTRADGVTVINDAYNANPDSMRAGLQALAAMARSAGKSSWAVLGEMGELGEESKPSTTASVGWRCA